MQVVPILYPTEAVRNWSVATLNQDKEKLNGYSVAIQKQEHAGGKSLAFRYTFPQTGIAYVTDTTPSEESITFVKNVPLLLHEHYFPGKEKGGGRNIADYFECKHTTTRGAAMIAKQANAGKLALIHHYPFADKKKLEGQLQLAQKVFPNILLARDLQAIIF